MPTIVFPTLNEVRNIRPLIHKAKELYPNFNILVADSGSTDGTREAAEDCGAFVFNLPKGKGRAMRFVLEHVDSDYLFALDADGSYPLEYINDMYYLLKNCAYDFVVGNRLSGRIVPGAMSKAHFWGNKGLTFFANMLYKTKTGDINSGMWGMNRYAQEEIQLSATKFDLEANLFTEVNNKRLRFCEVPIQFNKREYGESKLRIVDGLSIIKILVRERFK